MDEFAERLSKHDYRRGDYGGDIAKAAASMDQTPDWGLRQFAAICKGLGRQALAADLGWRPNKSLDAA